MPQYFDPMKSMNALAGGMELGSHIRDKQTMNALAPMVAKGDYKGAMEYAGSRGDLGQVQDMKTQYEAQLANMSEQDKAAAAKRAETLARTAAGLQGVPYEQRKTMLMQNMPVLQEMGIDPQMIQNFDPTDEGIGQVLAQVTPLTELLKKPTYFAPTETTGSDGNPVLTQFANDGSTPITAPVSPYQKPEGPLSPIGDLVADLNAGRITPEQYQIAVDRMQKSDPGLDIQFGEGGALSALTYGSSNRGKDAALVRTPDNTAAVSPGEQQARYNKVLATNKTLDVSDEVVAEDLDRAIGMAGAWTTGFIGAKLEDLQGTPAHDLKMLMQSIKANIGFDKLQQMRDNSPTGGALGQVTELELGLLQSVYGALEQSQTKEQFVYNLDRLKKIKQKFADLRAEAFAMDYPDIATTGQFRSNTNEQVSDWNDADEARLRELEARMGAQ